MRLEFREEPEARGLRWEVSALPGTRARVERREEVRDGALKARNPGDEKQQTWQRAPSQTAGEEAWEKHPAACWFVFQDVQCPDQQGSRIVVSSPSSLCQVAPDIIHRFPWPREIEAVV